MSTRTETKAQKELMRMTRCFVETPTDYWKQEVLRAVGAVEEEARLASQEREARYIAAQAAEPLWWDDASYAAYQARS
jgi:hypothetical protein